MDNKTIKCICGKEFKIKNLTGTTCYHGKEYYLNDGTVLVQSQTYGLLCKECFDYVNQTDLNNEFQDKALK